MISVVANRPRSSSSPVRGGRWEKIIELRVEDHPEPLIELRRLVTMHDAYVVAGEGDELAGESRHDEAAAKYVEAYERAPDAIELEFWAALAQIQQGDVDSGLTHLRATIAENPGWRELLDVLEPHTSPIAAEARRLLDG